MKAVAAVLVLAAVVVAVVVLKTRPPTPKASATASPAPSGSAAPAAGPLWPLEVGTAWIYTETSPDRPEAVEVTVTVSTEERTGVRLVEERGGKGSDSDVIEIRGDGYYFSEYESAKESTLLLPKQAPQVRDWSCRSDLRAAIARETEFTFGEQTVKAFEVRYEKKHTGDGAESWREHMVLTFAPGVGIVRKDTTQQEAPKGAPGKPVRYLWELKKMTPGPSGAGGSTSR